MDRDLRALFESSWWCWCEVKRVELAVGGRAPATAVGVTFRTRIAVFHAAQADVLPVASSRELQSSSRSSYDVWIRKRFGSSNHGARWVTD